MMALLNHVLKGDVIQGDSAQVGGTSKASNRIPANSTSATNVKSMVQFYERCCSSSRVFKAEGEQDFDSAMEMRRSPRQKPTVPNFQQHPATPPTSGNTILVNVATKSAAAGPPPAEEANSDASTKDIRQGNGGVKRKSSSVHKEYSAPPPPEEANSDASTKDIRRGNREVKRKSSSVHKELILAVENASKLFSESIDRIHSANLQIAEDRVKAQEHLFYTELDYLKKRDRQVNRNQKNLISAINGLTKIIITGLKNTTGAGDAIKESTGGGHINVEATGHETLRIVENATGQATDAQE